jgi:hypothetical protein
MLICKSVRAYLDVQVELPQAGVISLNLEGGGAAASCWARAPAAPDSSKDAASFGVPPGLKRLVPLPRSVSQMRFHYTVC